MKAMKSKSMKASKPVMTKTGLADAIATAHELHIESQGVAFCPNGQATSAARAIAAAGGGRVGVYDPEFVFEAENPVFERFVSRLK